MKKILALLSLLLSFSFISCAPEHQEPDTQVTVDFSIELNGVSVNNGTVYAVVGESLSVASISSSSVSSLQANFRGATCLVDGYALKSKDSNPPSITFIDENVGTHFLSFAATMEREDLSQFGMAMNLPLVVVESYEDLPSAAPQLGSHTYTIRVKK